MSVARSSTKAKNGFFMLSNSFVDSGTLASLSNSALRVYLVIFRLSNSAKNVAFPSYTAIMKSSGIRSRGAVSKGLKELESCGIITKITKGSNLTRQSNTYRINNTATVVTGVSQVPITSPTNQGMMPSSTPVSTAAAIPRIDGVLQITGIEEIDIKLTEAYDLGIRAKADEVIRLTSDDILPISQRIAAYDSIRELFKK